MGIPLNSQFDVNAALPLDSRFSFPDIASRDALAAGKRYEGMIAYVGGTDDKLYHLKGGITNADWAELGGGASSVLGPASSVDDEMVRFDLATGKLIKGSPYTVSDAGIISRKTGGSLELTTVDTNGRLIFRRKTINYSYGYFDYASDNASGSNATLTAIAKKYVVLTNAALVSIDGIPAIADSFTEICLVNDTGAVVTVNHLTGTTANQIYFPDAKSFKMKPKAILLLSYNTITSKWYVIGGTGSGSGTSETRTLAVDTTLTIDDDVVFVDTTAATVTMTLPSAVTAGNGKKITIKKIIMDDFLVTVAGTIDGVTNFDIGNQNAVTFISNGTNWYSL